MERNVKVTFSSEDKNFSQGLSGMEAKVANMYGSFVKSAKKYADSSKDAFQSIEEQIRNQERLFKGAYEKTKAMASSQYVTGAISEEQYRGKLQGARSAYDDSRQITALLRELIETDKNLNREALSQERRQVQEDRISEQQKRLEDRKEREKERDDSRGGQRRDARVVDIVNIMKGFAGAQNVYQGIATAVPAATSLFTGNPIINAISSLIGDGLKRGYEEGAKFTRSAANISQITGRDYSQYTGRGVLNNAQEQAYTNLKARVAATESKAMDIRTDVFAGSSLEGSPWTAGLFPEAKLGMIMAQKTGTLSSDLTQYMPKSEISKYRSDKESLLKLEKAKAYFSGVSSMDISRANSYGYSAAELNEISARTARATGNFSYEGGLRSMELQKGLGISEEQVSGLNRQGRVTGEDAYRAVEMMFGNLAARGKMTSGNTALLPEYLQQMVDIGNQQLDKLGTIADSDTTAGKIASITALTGSNNPDLIKQLLPKLEQGFSESANPQVRAMQYQTMAEMGETNIFDMRKKMEAPLQNRGYMASMIKKLKAMAGGDTQLAGSYLSSMMNISQTQGEALMGSESNWDEFAAGKNGGEITDALKGFSPKDRAMGGKGTTETEIRTAQMLSKFQIAGAFMLEKTEAMLNAFEKMSTDSKEISTAMADSATSAAKVRANLDKAATGTLPTPTVNGNKK